MKDYIQLMRPQHYIKNLLIFIALVCSGQFFNLEKLTAAFIGFIVFSAVSSSVYIINDIKDKEKDKLHPIKSKRPVASGRISQRNAILLCIFLLIVAISASFLIFSYNSVLLICLYIAINISYSFGLKNVPLIDITILAFGFIIRVLYGAAITGIVVSDWLYLTVFSVSFYFALGKRRNELKQISNGETRPVLHFYPEQFLNNVMYMCLGLANVFYALWAMEKNNSINSSNSSNYIIWTVPLVILISLAYSMNIEGESSGDPVDVLVHDKFLLFLCILFLFVMFCLLYI